MTDHQLLGGNNPVTVKLVTPFKSAEVPFDGQVYAKVDFDKPTEDDGQYTRPTEEAEIRNGANLVTSKVALSADVVDAFGTTLHKPVIDIDLPVTVVPSSTPGHCHLFIDKAMPWATYQRLLEALAVAGLVEPGYVNASIDRGYSAVRLPWVKKGEPVPATPDNTDINLESF